MDGRRWRLYFGLTLVLSLILISYLNTVNSPFHLDDYHSIVFNKNIRDIRNLPLYFTSTTMGSEVAREGYRPIVTASLALNYLMSGLDPWSYHVFNIIAHLATVAVFFFIALFFARKTNQDAYIALAAAGIFGLHAVHTNAVSYVIARSAIICAFFYLSSFNAYIRYRDTGGRIWLGVSAASFFLALLSKEVAVTLPLMLILYERLVLKGKSKKDYIAPALLLLLSGIYTLARFYSIHKLDIGGLAKSGNLLAQPRVILGYLKLFFFPVNLNFFPMVEVPGSPAEPSFLIPFLVILFIMAAILHISRKNGLAAFFLAWFFIALIPETFSNLKDLMIEYRLYLPSAGLVLVAIPLSAKVRSGPYTKRLTAGLAISVMVIFSFLVHERNKVYRDDITLWEDVVKKSPRSAEGYAALGTGYLEANRNKEAAEALSTALYLDPNIPKAADHYCNLGLALELSGENARAIEAYKKAIELNPYDPVTLRSVGVLMMKLNRRDDAVYYIKRALSLRPDDYVLQTLLLQAGG